MKPQVDSQKAPANSSSQPKGLYVLAFAEMWERMSFYGTKGLLKTFLCATVVTGGWAFKSNEASVIVSLYAGLVYFACFPGGQIADRYLGMRNSVLLGAVFQGIGHFLLALESVSAFLGGAWLLIIGTGLLKPNISSLVGMLYKKGSSLRNKGFSLFYQGINLGGILANIPVYVGKNHSYSYGFGLAGLGMLLSILALWLGNKHIPADKSKDAVSQKSTLTVIVVAVIGILAIFGLSYVLDKDMALNAAATFRTLAIVFLSVGIVGSLIYFYYQSANKQERDRVILLGIVCFSAFILVSIAEQASNFLMTFFDEKQLSKESITILGYSFSRPSVEIINVGTNPISIVVLAPIVTWIWSQLERSKSIPSLVSTTKIGVGLIVQGLACVLFVLNLPGEGQTMSLIWLVLYYFISAFAELCVIMIALSFVTKIVLEKHKSSMMALVWMSVSLGGMLSGPIGELAGTEALGAGYVFTGVAALFFVVGIFYVLMNNVFLRMSHGAERVTEQH